MPCLSAKPLTFFSVAEQTAMTSVYGTERRASRWMEAMNCEPIKPTRMGFIAQLADNDQETDECREMIKDGNEKASRIRWRIPLAFFVPPLFLRSAAPHLVLGERMYRPFALRLGQRFQDG